MRKIFIVTLATFPCFAMAADTFSCIYSKADIRNGIAGKMLGRESAKVEVINGAMKAYRPNGVYLLSPPMKEDLKTLWKAEDASKIYVMSQDFTSFAVSDRIAKTTEQWANCSIDKAPSPQKKSEDKMIAVEGLSGEKAKSFFMKEKHAFTTNCLVWEDVTMITGRYPAMIIAGSVMMGKNPRWDGREYSFTFNGGSMMARFVPSEPRHKFVIQAGDKFYGCGPSEIDHNYE